MHVNGHLEVMPHGEEYLKKSIKWEGFVKMERAQKYSTIFEILLQLLTILLIASRNVAYIPSIHLQYRLSLIQVSLYI